MSFKLGIGGRFGWPLVQTQQIVEDVISIRQLTILFAIARRSSENLFLELRSLLIELQFFGGFFFAKEVVISQVCGEQFLGLKILRIIGDQSPGDFQSARNVAANIAGIAILPAIILAQLHVGL